MNINFKSITYFSVPVLVVPSDNEILELAKVTGEEFYWQDDRE